MKIKEDLRKDIERSISIIAKRNNVMDDEVIYAMSIVADEQISKHHSSLWGS